MSVPAHKNTEHPAGQIVNPVMQGKPTSKEIEIYLAEKEALDKLFKDLEIKETK